TSANFCSRTLVEERFAQHVGVETAGVEGLSARCAGQPYLGGTEQQRVDLVEVVVVALEDVVEGRAVVERGERRQGGPQAGPPPVGGAAGRRAARPASSSLVALTT